MTSILHADLTKQIELVFKSEKSENLSPSYLEAYMWHDRVNFDIS